MLAFPLLLTDEEMKVSRASGDMLKSVPFAPGGSHLPEMAGMRHTRHPLPSQVRCIGSH